jgi:hypothetical protein
LTDSQQIMKPAQYKRPGATWSDVELESIHLRK